MVQRPKQKPCDHVVWSFLFHSVIQLCSLIEEIEAFRRTSGSGKYHLGFVLEDRIISNNVSESKDRLNIEREAIKTRTKWLDSRQKFALNLNNPSHESNQSFKRFTVFATVNN